jgi:hypothetical protein
MEARPFGARMGWLAHAVVQSSAQQSALLNLAVGNYRRVIDGFLRKTKTPRSYD